MRAVLAVASALGLLVLGSVAQADDVGISPDVSVDLSGAILNDEDAAVDLGAAGFSFEAFGSPSTHADVSAYHVLGVSDRLMTFDITVELPGGLRAEPRDVVLWDGVSHSIYFDGAAAGITDGVRIDALTEIAGSLVASFDTTTSFSGTIVDDEDLVDLASAALLFDGSAAGVAASLDLDGASLLPNGHLGLSFDGSGDVGAGFFFDDEDVLEYVPGSGVWSLHYDASAAHAGYAGADVDAVYVVPEPDSTLSLVAGLGLLWVVGKSARTRSRWRFTS